MYFAAYWWFAVLVGLTALHFLGVLLVLMNRTQPWVGRLTWGFFSLFLSVPVMLVYWLYVVERGKSILKPPHSQY